MPACAAARGPTWPGRSAQGDIREEDRPGALSQTRRYGPRTRCCARALAGDRGGHATAQTASRRTLGSATGTGHHRTTTTPQNRQRHKHHRRRLVRRFQENSHQILAQIGRSSAPHTASLAASGRAERRLRVLRLKEGRSRNVAQGGHALTRVQSSSGRRQADCAAAGSGAEVGQMRWSQVALNGCDDAYRLTRIPCKQGFPCSSAAWQHCCGPGCRGFESHRSPQVKQQVSALTCDYAGLGLVRFARFWGGG